MHALLYERHWRNRPCLCEIHDQAVPCVSETTNALKIMGTPQGEASLELSIFLPCLVEDYLKGDNLVIVEHLFI